LAPRHRGGKQRRGAPVAPINLLAQSRPRSGDLDKVVRVVRLGGFVNSAPDFLDGRRC